MIDERMATVWWDGALVAEGEALVSALSQGVQYGYGLFETVRAYEGVVFRLDDHLDRFVRSAQRIDLAPPSLEAVRQAIDATLAANHLRDAALRLSAFAARPGGAPAPSTQAATPATLLVAPAPLPDWSAARTQGATAIVSRHRRDASSELAGLKTTSALASLLVRREAGARGVDEALLLTHGGHVSEFSAANAFFVRDGVLLTPSLACGCLQGVTRSVVLSLAPRLGASVAEGAFTLEDLTTATECFMSGSVREIVPIISLDGRAIGGGTPGALTRDVQAAYAEIVREEVAVARAR